MGGLSILTSQRRDIRRRRGFGSQILRRGMLRHGARIYPPSAILSRVITENIYGSTFCLISTTGWDAHAQRG